jgi:hypothetical protein
MIKNKIAHIFCLLLLSISAFAQPKDISPLSRFGIGDFAEENFVNLQSMGGVSAAYADPYNTNLVNPASIAHLRVTSFEFGVNAKYKQLKNQDLSENIGSGGLGYASLAFPLRNSINKLLDRKEYKWNYGMSFSIRPYTNVNYDIISLDTSNADIGRVTRLFEGSGGTYKFEWGLSAQTNNFSFGMSLGYLLGNISNRREVFTSDVVASLRPAIDSEYAVSGFIWKAGLIYDLKLNDKKTLSFGIYGNTDVTFNTNGSQLERRINEDLGINDTISYQRNLEGKGLLPSEIGFGIYYKAEKTNLGISFKTSDWSKYSNEANPAETPLAKAWRLGAGGFIIPNDRSLKYFKRVAYKFGGFVGKDPRSGLINNEELDYYGVTLGMGLPFVFQRQVSFVNLGVELGRMGTETLIQETYFKFSVGITFNDNTWFQKRKYY